MIRMVERDEEMLARYAGIGDFERDLWFTDEEIHPMRTLLVIASIINSALILSAIFIAGLMTNNGPAWKLAICTMGLCYVAPTVQLMFPAQRLIAMVLVGASVIFGLMALIAITGILP